MKVQIEIELSQTEKLDELKDRLKTGNLFTENRAKNAEQVIWDNELLIKCEIDEQKNVFELIHCIHSAIIIVQGNYWSSSKFNVSVPEMKFDAIVWVLSDSFKEAKLKKWEGK